MQAAVVYGVRFVREITLYTVVPRFPLCGLFMTYIHTYIQSVLVEAIHVHT